MKNQQYFLQKRKTELTHMYRSVRARLADAPDGTLVIRHPNGRTEYYHKASGKPGKEIYIPRKNTELVRILAQKEYDIKVLRLITHQIKEIEKYNKPYFPGSLDNAFYSLSAERQKIVTPAEPTTKQFIDLWQNKLYPESRFPIDPEKPNYTDRGEPVRSKSEVLIANALYHLGIPYKYEYPILLGRDEIRPDFTILNICTRREIYFEHFGMMDDQEYVTGFLRKMDLYAAYGIFPGDGLICTFESSAHSLDTRTLKKLIEHELTEDCSG